MPVDHREIIDTSSNNWDESCQGRDYDARMGSKVREDNRVIAEKNDIGVFLLEQIATDNGDCIISINNQTLVGAQPEQSL